MHSPPRSLVALLATTSLFGSSCGGGGAGSGGDVGPPLDEVLTNAARAGVVTRSHELLPGERAKGRLGDIRLYNDKVAFVIEAAGPSDGYNPWGGGILDASRLGSDGAPGPTWFGELIVGINIVGVDAESVEVLSDGLEGGAAVVRVVGRGAPFEMFGELLDAPDMPGPMWIEYSLDPGADALTMSVGFENAGASVIDVPHLELGFLMGDGATPFTPGGGFDLNRIEPRFDWYGAFAADVGYQVAWEGGPMSRLMSVIGVVLAYAPGDALAPGDVLERVFRIGVLAPGGSPPTGDVEVQVEVRQADGESGPDRRVDAFLGARHMGFAWTDAAGRASLSLPPGDHVLRVDEAVAVDGRITLPPVGELSFTIQDDVGRPIPARLEVLEEESGARTARLFTVHGEGVVELEEGDYRVVVGRGFEYTLADESIRIDAGRVSTLDVVLERVVDTSGWVSSDFHLHAQGSPDSDDTNEYKVSALAAEGVEVPVSTDHDNITDWQPAVVALGLEEHVRMIIGEEVTTYAYGHFNVFPLAVDSEALNGGAFRWFQVEAPDLFDSIRRDAPAGHVIQVNHPRATRFGGYMEAVGFDPDSASFTRPDMLSLEFDAIEVTNGKRGEGAATSQGFQDWVGLLAGGHRVAGTGNSDSHHALTTLVGFPRNFVQVGKDDPPAVTGQDLADAVHGLRLSVSAGPFVTARLDEAGDVDVRVQAAPWVAVDRLQLVVDGEVVDTVALSGARESVVRFEGVLETNLDQDAFVIVVVEGDAPMDPLYPGKLPFAFTNPLFVDVDGDGTWTPPRGF